MEAMVFDLGLVKMHEAEGYDLTSIEYWWKRVRARAERPQTKVKMTPPKPVIPHPSRRR